MRVLGKTGLFGADRRGLGRARAVRSVRGGAAKRGKTNSNQLDNSAKLRKSCPIALFSRVLPLSGTSKTRSINWTENRFTTKSKQREKSSGSTLGFSVLGGAAFCVAALVEICPEYRLFFPGADPAVLVVNQVKNFLLSIHRQ